jgi:outer membrane lipoprotein SlyB
MASHRRRERRRSAHNVTARYPDRRSAQQAVEALGWRGVEGSDVTIDAPGAERDLTIDDTRAADEIIASRTVGHAAMGFTTGLVLGAILGAVVGGIINLIVDGGLLGWSFYITLLAGAIFGLIVGAILGGESALQAQREFEITETPGSDGEVTVGVHRSDAKDIERTERVLRQHGATDVRREDAEGHPE